MMAVLNKIRIEAEGEKPLIVYRRIYDVRAVGIPNALRTRRRKAFRRYNKQKIVVYLESEQWVSYGEVADSRFSGKQASVRTL